MFCAYKADIKASGDIWFPEQRVISQLDLERCGFCASTMCIKHISLGEKKKEKESRNYFYLSAVCQLNESKG